MPVQCDDCACGVVTVVVTLVTVDVLHTYSNSPVTSIQVFPVGSEMLTFIVSIRAIRMLTHPTLCKRLHTFTEQPIAPTTQPVRRCPRCSDLLPLLRQLP